MRFINKESDLQIPVRSEAVSEVLDRMSNDLFGQTVSQAQTTLHCVACYRDADMFRDGISRREYGISGLCQHCQDKVFGADFLGKD